MNAEAVADWIPIMLVAALAAACVLTGYAIGRRHSRRVRRELSRSLSVRSIELLEARTERSRLVERLAEEPPRERLLRVARARLQESRRRERALFVDRARWRLAALESARRAREAARLARLAAARSRALEGGEIATGSITTRAAKSYGKGTPVTVGVVDRETLADRREGMSRVPPRDRIRLTRLAPSNETRDVESAERDDDQPGTHG